MREISNDDLTLSDVPQSDADWEVIGEFALTFNGYEYWGSFEKCAEVANRRNPGNLVEARTCLFFLQRALRHQGDGPDENDYEYIGMLLGKIREFLAAKE